MKERTGFGYKWYMILACLLITKSVYGQLQYTFDQSIPIVSEGSELALAWAGGLNAPQFNQMDLNNDGKLDLVVFERSNQQLKTFIWNGSAYDYAPDYEQFFPKTINDWVLLRDFNCDGKPDLFTSTLFGMAVYANASDGQSIQWVEAFPYLFTEGTNSQVNLQMNATDIPSIEDMDGDGDLDILVFGFSGTGKIEFHKNYSVENTGTCGMELVRETKSWGEVEECACGNYAFEGVPCINSGRLEHVGGKTLTLLDVDGNGAKDLLIGDEGCNGFSMLQNEGTTVAPVFSSLNVDFPTVESPIALTFPAAYKVDINLDGINDVIATSNKYNSDAEVDYANTTEVFLANSNGTLTQSASFLQEKMLDVGHQSSSVALDIDKDGDNDLLIGAKSNNGKPATVWLLENIENTTDPAFAITDKDYLGLSQWGASLLELQAVDYDKDGNDDILLKTVINTDVEYRWLRNSGSFLLPFEADKASQISMPLFDGNDKAVFYDLSGDNKAELLLAKADGSLQYYINNGTEGAPDWLLHEDAFLGLTPNYQRANLSVAVADLNDDGLPDLITHDSGGAITVYTDFLNNNTPTTDIVYSTKAQQMYAPSFGKRAYVCVVDLFGTTEPSLLIGSVAGGVQLLKSTSEQIITKELTLQLDLFPNPTYAGITINVITNIASEIDVLNVYGQAIGPVFKTEPRAVLTIENTLAAGVYFIRAKAIDGQVIVKRLVVSN